MASLPDQEAWLSIQDHCPLTVKFNTVMSGGRGLGQTGQGWVCPLSGREEGGGQGGTGMPFTSLGLGRSSCPPHIEGQMGEKPEPFRRYGKPTHPHPDLEGITKFIPVYFSILLRATFHNIMPKNKYHFKKSYFTKPEFCSCTTSKHVQI